MQFSTLNANYHQLYRVLDLLDRQPQRNHILYSFTRYQGNTQSHAINLNRDCDIGTQLKNTRTLAKNSFNIINKNQ